MCSALLPLSKDMKYLYLLGIFFRRVSEETPAY